MITDDEIEKFINILKLVDNNNLEISNKVVCKICQVHDFFINSGQYYCSKCFYSQGHVLGYHDKSDYERFYFSQKSIFKIKIRLKK